MIFHRDIRQGDALFGLRSLADIRQVQIVLSKSGTGQFIDVSLLQVAIAFIESHVADFLNGGEAVSRENFPKGRIYSLLDCGGFNPD